MDIEILVADVSGTWRRIYLMLQRLRNNLPSSAQFSLLQATENGDTSIGVPKTHLLLKIANLGVSSDVAQKLKSEIYQRLNSQDDCRLTAPFVLASHSDIRLPLRFVSGQREGESIYYEIHDATCRYVASAQSWEMGYLISCLLTIAQSGNIAEIAIVNSDGVLPIDWKTRRDEVLRSVTQKPAIAQ